MDVHRPNLIIETKEYELKQKIRIMYQNTVHFYFKTHLELTTIILICCYKSDFYVYVFQPKSFDKKKYFFYISIFLF